MRFVLLASLLVFSVANAEEPSEMNVDHMQGFTDSVDSGLSVTSGHSSENSAIIEMYYQA